jgi:predicted transcriptional regulator
MENKRDRAHDIAEEGLDKVVEGDVEAGKTMIDRARKIDPKAVDELADEVERDRAKAERYIQKK